MSLIVHRARRADELVPGLAALLRDPLPDPFEQELVLVPARGVERWLSQRLSHLLGHGEGREDGVCAGVGFRSPASLVAELVIGGAGTREHDPWSPDALVWPLLAVVDAHAGEAWCRVLSQHLGHGETGEEGELRRGRRYAVARRLAQLFASYAVQRPLLLSAWESGDDSDGAGGVLDADLAWQPELWRLLVAQVDAPSPRERHLGVLAALRERPQEIRLPARFSLFGHTRIPATEVELLGALGEHRDVHVWLPHPSPALWDALDDLATAVPRSEDVSHERVGHPLLASLGRDVRELERSLAPVVTTSVVEEPATAATPRDTVLSWLQQDIAANSSVDPATRALDPDDRSVQVHACHGPSRQVEVLREVVLGLLSDDPTLEPRDVLVMCPDIESYAPLIEAAFGMGPAVAGGHPGQQLQVRLADRALTQTNPLLAVVGTLLDLAGGRAEASAVLDLVASGPVRRRFGLAESDLETITSWIEQAGVRWAFDAEHRAPYGLEGYVQNTWQFGVDRVLAGVAMSDDAERWIGTTLPLDDVGSTTIDLAGRLAELLDRLQHVTDRLTGSHPVDDWLDALREGIDALTSVARGDEWQTAQVQRELSALGVDASRPGQALELRLPDVRALMSERLAGQPTRANFRTGTLTVCTMVPMRSVPHRVVCLLGLDDGVYPRASAVDGDNVLARRPLTGERDLRSEDRQLMLDAIMATQEHLVVTYSGANETNGQPRPPAVPLGELLDALDDTVTGGRAHALRAATPGSAGGDGVAGRDGHPLQAFDPCNFRPPVPFSFDRASLAGARAARRDREPVPSLADTTLPAQPADDLELASLVTFFRHPVRAFLRDRLGVALPDEGEEVADGLPVELDNLQQWGVGDRLLRDLLRGRTPDQALGTEWRRGVLPPGRLGWRLGQALTKDAAPVAEMVESVTQGQEARAVDVDVDLGAGRRLRGTVSGVHDHRVVSATFSRLGPRQWLESWIPLLALCATHPGRPWSAGAVGRGEKGRHGSPDDAVARIAFASVEGATDLLQELVTMYDAGMRAPLPLPLRTGHAWAARRRPGNNNEFASRKDAEFKWLSNRFPGENDDAPHVAVWGPDAPLDVLLGPPLPGEEYAGETTRLGALAMRLWRPMIERRH